MLTEVNQARSLVKDYIIAPYFQQIDKCLTVAQMVPATVKVIKDLSKSILSTSYSTVDNSLLLTNEIFQAAKALQDAIDAKNQKSIEEVKAIEEIR